MIWIVAHISLLAGMAWAYMASEILVNIVKETEKFVSV